MDRPRRSVIPPLRGHAWRLTPRYSLPGREAGTLPPWGVGFPPNNSILPTGLRLVGTASPVFSLGPGWSPNKRKEQQQ